MRSVRMEYDYPRRIRRFRVLRNVFVAMLAQEQGSLFLMRFVHVGSYHLFLLRSWLGNLVATTWEAVDIAEAFSLYQD